MTDTYFDRDAGLLDRAVFSSEALYRQEVSRIFGRVWLFVGPENWARAKGEYFTTSMGETPVIVWKSETGLPRVFINRCAAGAGALATPERGVADELSCSCHGYRYGLDGVVVDRPHLRASEVPRSEVYQGLIFANLDAKAQTLSSYLGDFAWYFDMLVDRRAGGVEVHGGAAFRWLVDANWKAPAEAFAGDAYRDLTLHAATDAVTNYRPPSTQTQGLQVSAGAGAIALLEHAPDYAYPAVVEVYERSIAPEVEGRLGAERASHLIPTIGTLFPNLSFDWRTRSLHVWRPRGARQTEIHTYCFVDCAAPADVKDALLRVCQFHYGPAGLRSQDDVGPWTSITEKAGSLLGQRSKLNLQMGIGEEIQRNIPGRVSDLFSEMNQRSFYAWWQDRLNDDDLGPDPTSMMRIAPPRRSPE